MNADYELSIKEFNSLKSKDYILLDVRDEMAYSYGHLPGAVNIAQKDLQYHIDELRGKKVIVYCKKGQISTEVTEYLRQNGVESYNLSGGYIAWLMEEEEKLDEADDDGEFCRKVEESIRKRFRKKIWCQFTRAVREYELVKEGDRIAVCISGGKDSMLMAKLFQELKRHNKFPFELVFLVMDPGYSPENRRIIENNAGRLGIPIQIFETNIFEAVLHVEESGQRSSSSCYLCARMRRGNLYAKAEELGCNKIALGHHYDDVIETILLGMLYGAQIQSMMPKLHGTNFSGMQLIRPMYLIREESIKAWRDANNLHFIQCACRFTETCSTCQDDGQNNSKRLEVKKLIAEMKKTNPFVEGNIFKSMENVMLDTVIEYKQNGVRHHFLDNYDSPHET